jgi:hypothetical protein
MLIAVALGEYIQPVAKLSVRGAVPRTQRECMLLVEAPGDEPIKIPLITRFLEATQRLQSRSPGALQLLEASLYPVRVQHTIRGPNGIDQLRVLKG